MKHSQWSWRCGAFIFLLGSFVYKSAALQLISSLAPSFTSPPNGNGDSWAPVISPDGRYVLFASTANNLVLGSSSNGIPGGFPFHANVYLRDRQAGTTTLVSVNTSDTGGGNGNSFPTGLSTNGQFALFESAASNLVPYDTNNANDVFLRDVLNGVTWVVSVATNGTVGNGSSRGSTLSPDGRYVAFTSAASNLAPNDTNGIADVFVRDMQLGTTTLASLGAMGGATNSSEAPEITPDGHYVAFYSSATNLVAGISSKDEIYVRDLIGGTTTCASTNARAISKLGTTGFSYNQALSDDGQFIAFEISWNGVQSVRTTNGYILRYDMQTGLTAIISSNAYLPNGIPAELRSLNMTPDGRFIAFVAYTTSGNCVLLWDAQTGSNTLVSANLSNAASPGASVSWPDVDPTGRYVVFSSTDTNLTTNGSAGVFLRDVQAGATTQVSVDSNGASLSVAPSAVPSLAANGATVAFETPYANLDGRNFENDVFARDLTNPVAELISAHDPALPSLSANGPSAVWPGSVSTNGHYIAFTSSANNLAPNDTNRCTDVFVRDVLAGTNILVSADPNGFAGIGNSTEPSISGDGRYVAFTSQAINLVLNDTNKVSDVFVRDLQSGTTTLVSVSANGGIGNGASYLPVVSVDGRYVMFWSLAGNLAALTYPVTANNLFFHDLQAGQTYGLTVGSVISSSMTPDGHFVAFASPTNLCVWDSQALSLIYSNAFPPLTSVSLSPDGHWLAFVSSNSLYAQDLVAGTNFSIANGPFGARAGFRFSNDGRFLTYAGTNDVFVYDFVSGTNLLLSQKFYSNKPGNGASDSPVLSPDGRLVAYRSFASDIVPADANGVPDVFLFDRAADATMLVSQSLSGVNTANNRSLAPVFSGDGQTLVFQTWANDLVPQQFSLGGDICSADLSAFSASNATNPPPAFGASFFLSSELSPNEPSGTVVAWPFTPGHSYSVQYKDDLGQPTWQTLAGNITVFGSQAFLNDLAPSANRRFYRIVLNN